MFFPFTITGNLLLGRASEFQVHWCPVEDTYSQMERGLPGTHTKQGLDCFAHGSAPVPRTVAGTQGGTPSIVGEWRQNANSKLWLLMLPKMTTVMLPFLISSAAYPKMNKKGDSETHSFEEPQRAQDKVKVFFSFSFMLSLSTCSSAKILRIQRWGMESNPDGWSPFFHSGTN